MLPRSNRLGRSDALTQVLRKGRVVRQVGMQLRVMRTQNLHSRFAIAVSQKAEKSSVKRNRIRRQLFGFIADHIPNFSFPCDCVITVYKEACVESAVTRRATCQALLRLARLLP